jgi:bifunctional UDP-N-acetylglucosamine pyrophosphorylase/glucosamine-1-phosphate N-acetyltransferase
MKSAKPKVLHEIGNRPILGHILMALDAIGASRKVVVVGKGHASVRAYAEGLGAATAVQDPPLGTGDAARAALPALEGFEGDALVLYGDNPLLTPATLRALMARRGDAALSLMGFTPADPGAYGRLVLNEAGDLERIVEHKDASAEIRAIRFCNAGGFFLDASLLRTLLAELTDENEQREYYLTDIVTGAGKRGLRCVAHDAPPDDVMGVNSRAELAVAEAVFQDRARAAAMADGVTLADPATVYFSADTKLGRDVSVGQQVVFGPGATVEDGVTIKPFCHLEGVIVRRDAVIGPYARLRPGSDIGEGAHIGNFVETKAAKIGKGAKANHLTYLGDAEVGAGANVGAGTITCNYDGFFKYKTTIGEGAFIGSNSALVAPVTVGAGAYVGAGSVITHDVAPDSLGVERAKQAGVDGWAVKFRARMRARKEAAQKDAKKD